MQILTSGDSRGAFLWVAKANLFQYPTVMAMDLAALAGAIQALWLAAAHRYVRRVLWRGRASLHHGAR